MANSAWIVTAYAVQLAALVVIACSATSLLRMRAPRHSLHFWQIVIAIALLLPLAQPRGTSRPELPLVSALTSTSAAAAAPGGSIATAFAVDLPTIVMLILAAGVVIRLLWLSLGLVRLRSIVGRATTGESLAAVSNPLMESLGVSAVVKVSDDLEGPATVGFRAPVVLVPPSVLTMSAAVQRAILCHELLHVKRRDWLHTIGEELWRSMLWFHPLARLVASRLSLSREMVVDEMTILITRDRRAYAEALLAFSNPQPHVIGVTPFIGRRTLSQRISIIAEESPMPHHRALASACLALTACLAITAVAVDRFPMFATLQAQTKPYKPGNGVSLPVVEREAKADYTREAMQAMIQGSVFMAVVIDEHGDVADVQITQSLDKEYGLDEAAMAAMKQWKFRPGRKDGKPVPVEVTIEMSFRLK